MPVDSTTIPTTILKPTGLEPTPYRVRSLAEAVDFEPRGVYTVARTFHGDHVLLLDAHLDRLEQSARMVGIPLHLDRSRLRKALRQLIQRAGYAETRFRITVGHDHPDWIYLAVEPFQPVPERVLREGAHVITLPLVRENPVVKTTDWMTVRRPAFSSLPDGVYEAIMVSADGYLLEGLSSNFYAVIDNVLHTAGDGVLAGITRLAICEIAPTVVPLSFEPPHRDDVPRFTEAMLTSSGRGVVPITVIDEQPVGTGRVGPIVSQLMQRYEMWTEEHIEPI